MKRRREKSKFIAFYYLCHIRFQLIFNLLQPNRQEKFMRLVSEVARKF